MMHLQPWQRILYFLGEAVMIAGLLWGMWRILILRGCPVSPFNDITVIVVGLALSTIPLHPFGAHGYLKPALRSAPGAALLWWLLALIGIGYSLYLRFSSPVPAGFWWFFALVPAVLWFWLAIPSKLGDRPLPPTKAPPPPDGSGTDNDDSAATSAEEDQEQRSG